VLCKHFFTIFSFFFSGLDYVKLTDKPGSVVDSHSSRRPITQSLKQPTR